VAVDLGACSRAGFPPADGAEVNSDLVRCDSCGVTADGPSRTAEIACWVGATALCAVFGIWSLLDGEQRLGTVILLGMLPGAVNLRRLTRSTNPGEPDRRSD
jgi:hypothetical protein